MESDMDSVEMSRGSHRVVATPEDGNVKVRWSADGVVREADLAVVRVINSMEEKLEKHTKFTIQACEQIDTDGGPAIHIAAQVTTRMIAFGIWLTLDDSGALLVTVPMSELHDHNAIIFRTGSIDPLPGLLAVGPGDAGTLLVPFNVGGLIDPAGKDKLGDRWLIYGEQSRWELMPTMPVAGIQTRQGGVVLIATAGAEESGCAVSTDGESGGEVGMYAQVRTEKIDPIEVNDRVYRYEPIAAGADLVTEAGARLRRHIHEDLGKPMLEARCRENKDVAKLLKSYVMKLFYAVQMQGLIVHSDGRPSGPPEFRLHMTFDEAGQWLRKIKDAGVEQVHTQGVGWNPRGHDGLWPTKFPIEKRLGGESKFRQLIADGQSLGYTMTLHDNFASSMLLSPDHVEDWVRWNKYGEPDVKGFWGGGYKCIRLGQCTPSEWIDQQMDRTGDLGIDGTYYIDGIGNPLYVNYNPRHPGTRTDYGRGINKFLRHAREHFGSIATECGFLYNCLIPDMLCTHGEDWHARLCRDDWPITRMVDQVMPVAHIARSGLWMCEQLGLSWQGAMNSILLARHPRDEWSTHPGVMPIIDEKRIAQHKAMYDVAIKRFGHLQLEPIVEYQQDGPQRRSVFEGGTVVEADFDAQTLVVDGEQVERPEAL